jgi:hypothetical protein
MTTNHYTKEKKSMSKEEDKELQEKSLPFH